MSRSSHDLALDAARGFEAILMIDRLAFGTTERRLGLEGKDGITLVRTNRTYEGHGSTRNTSPGDVNMHSFH